MAKKYYAVIMKETEQGDHFVKRCLELKEANQFAKKNNGKLYEFEDKPLGRGENHKTRGKLIKDYS